MGDILPVAPKPAIYWDCRQPEQGRRLNNKAKGEDNAASEQDRRIESFGKRAAGLDWHHRVRQRHRHHDRMVRLLPLQHDDRARAQQAVLSQLRHIDLDTTGLCDVVRRVLVASDRRRDLRSLRRPYRAQDRAHPHRAYHGHRHIPDRLAADLCQCRRLGAAHAARAAYFSGHRHRRRMGRRRPDGGRTFSRRPARLLRQLASACPRVSSSPPPSSVCFRS